MVETSNVVKNNHLLGWLVQVDSTGADIVSPANGIASSDAESVATADRETLIGAERKCMTMAIKQETLLPILLPRRQSSRMTLRRWRALAESCAQFVYRCSSSAGQLYAKWTADAIAQVAAVASCSE